MARAVEICAELNMKKCKAEGCQNNVFSKGLCQFHMPKKLVLKKTPLKKKPPKKVPAKARSEKQYLKKGASKNGNRKRGVKTISKLKEALDRVFSVFIRLRDSDYNGIGTCITSGVQMPWIRLQNGHFMSRRFLATRWHEQNCASQSLAENVYMSGNQYEFGKALDRRWGTGTADEMVRLSKEHFKLTIPWLEEKIAHYHKQVQILKEEKGL
jgi:hypothetical protein